MSDFPFFTETDDEQIRRVATSVIGEMLKMRELMSWDNTETLAQDLINESVDDFVNEYDIDQKIEEAMGEMVTRDDVEEIASDAAGNAVNDLEDITSMYDIECMIEAHEGSGEIDVTQAVQAAFDSNDDVMDLQGEVTKLFGLVGEVEDGLSDEKRFRRNGTEDRDEQYVNVLGRLDSLRDDITEITKRDYHARLAILEAGNPEGCQQCEDTDLLAAFTMKENTRLRDRVAKLQGLLTEWCGVSSGEGFDD